MKNKLSFRSPGKQAAHAVRQLTAHGSPRHTQKGSGKIHSKGTERAFDQALKQLTAWLQQHKKGDLKSLTKEKAIEYLGQRAEHVGQKTLDLDRQAINAYLGIKLAVIASELTQIKQSRAYIPGHIELIAENQSSKYRLATQVAASAGLRAQELLTLMPEAERPADTHRQYREDRFKGLTGVLYTVAGKGGLCREVLIPTELSRQLEALRLETPKQVYDRGVQYTQHYNIGGGKLWTDSFRNASLKTLGWSTGAHGLRHTYAQLRIISLQKAYYSFEEAKLVVSQEMGHFRASVIAAYLR